MSKDDTYSFRWENLGDIELGRPNLGATTSVAAYRLMQYTLRHVMGKRLPVDLCNTILREAGELAGREFCRNVLDRSLSFNAFLSQLQEKLKAFRVGILRVEKSDLEKMEFTLTVDEDVDCSGLPPVGETVCGYDEGFLAGVMGEYTGSTFEACEIDCWSTGERTCRFEVVRVK